MSPRTVIITGASSGIGAALATQMIARGDRVALLARRKTALESVAEAALERARAAGVSTPRALIFPIDVTDRESMRRVIANVRQELGDVDLLILNAGIGDNTRVHDFDDRMAARTFEVNVVSTLYALGAVLPDMVVRRSGHIVGVSSIASYRGMPGAAAYSASKAALSTLLEGLRVDLRRHDVSVTTVSPGFVRTPLTAKNQHSMPLLMEPEAAAAIIIRGIDKKKREIRFPWRLALGVRVLRALPDWLFDAIMSRVERPASLPAETDPYRGAD